MICVLHCTLLFLHASGYLIMVSCTLCALDNGSRSLADLQLNQKWCLHVHIPKYYFGMLRYNQALT